MSSAEISPAPTTGPRRRPLIWAGLLLVLELGGIGTIFKHSIDFTCLDNWPVEACQGASGALVALYCAFGALLLFAMLRPEPLRRLTAQAGDRLWPLGMNALGVAIALVPVLFMRDGAGASVILPAFACWGVGMSLILAGLGLYIAPLPRWTHFLSRNWSTLIPVLGLGAIAPWLATQIRPLWQLDTIADVTFDAVAGLTRAVGYEVDTYPEDKIIGAGDFHISVAPQCSGVEGFALVTLFVSLYLWLFRQDMRFPRAFLLFPIGLAASAVFNVLRITVLLIIGLEGNAELAVGGFHSHAGWLMFTLVALGIVGLAQTVPALRKAEKVSNKAKSPPPPLPLLQDPAVLRILPFAVFMFSALLASAFASTPSVVYPARVALMAGTLALFWPLLKALPWRIDPVALAAGALIAALWIMVPVPPADSAIAPYGALTGTALVLWFIARGIGTTLLVPIIEELFFRDYLESRLTLGTGLRWRIFAAIVTASLFAALHARWVEAFVAGLIFSYVMQRRSNVTDAIVAHALANGIIFAWAVVSGNLSII